MTGASPGLDLLASSLIDAQKELQNIAADAEGQVGSLERGRKYKYLSLPKLLDEIRPVLAKHGLCVIQTCEPAEPDVLKLTTTLLHTSGQFISGTSTMPLPQATPQGAGSALTYSRRYSVAALLGIAADDDDDGATASQPLAARTRVAAPPPAASDGNWQNTQMVSLGTDTMARKRFFGTLRSEFGWDHETALAQLGITSFSKDCIGLTVGDVLTRCREVRQVSQ